MVPGPICGPDDKKIYGLQGNECSMDAASPNPAQRLRKGVLAVPPVLAQRHKLDHCTW